MKPLLFIVPAIPSPPTTGGEIFNQRLAAGLAANWDLTVVTVQDLGMNSRMSAGEFERRLVDFVRNRVEPGPVLLDTYLYPHFDGALDRCRRERDAALRKLGELGTDEAPARQDQANA